MISCPKCGAENPEGSRICSECGAPLLETGRRCPMCGAMNPPANVFCDRCHARLIPLVAGEPEEGGAEAAEERPPTGPPEEPSPPTGPFLGEEVQPAAEEADWLAELRAAVGEEEGEEAPPFVEEEPPAEIEVEVPEWLREAEAESPLAEPGAEGPSPEVQPEEAEVPEWLREVMAEVPLSEEGISEEAPEAPVEALPEEAEAPSAGEEIGPEAAEAPEWLQEAEERIGAGPFTVQPALEAAEAEAPAAPGEEEAPAAEEGVPEWLREVEEEAAPPVAEEAPVEEAVEASVPDWLLEAAASGEAAGAEAPPAGPEPETVSRVFISEEGLPPVEPGEVPDWLRELETPAETEPLPAVEPEVEGLVPAEIPDWLKALRPRAEGEAPEEPAETEGLLEGLRGTLQPSPMIGVGEGGRAIPSVTAKPASLARAELLQELLNRPVTSARRVEKERRPGFGQAVLRLLIGLLLLAAILAPMAGVWLPSGSGDVPAASAVFPDAKAAYDAIERQVDTGTPVLVAFEYGPSEAEEVEMVAGPLLQHLLNKGGRLILVSTHAEGPALAERLLAGLSGAGEGPERVVNLGYQPGQAVGVQGLLADLAGRTLYRSGQPAAQAAVMEGVRSARDVGLVIVLAGQVEDLRTWVEQVSARYPDLPVVAGVSARVEPIARPYLERTGAGVLKGLVAGLPGATVYQGFLGMEDEYARYYLQSLTLGQWAVAMLMVIGAVVFLVGGGKAR